MHEKATGDAIAVNPHEIVFLPFRKNDDSYNQAAVEKYDNHGAYKAVLFPYGTEDKIGTLFRYEIIFGLCPVQKPLP